METTILQPSDPLSRRLAGYLSERFPPAAYTLLVAVFYGSAAAAACALAGAPRPSAPRALAGAVMWLVFFHLRVFDEHKDAALDRVAHPERLLSRGVVTLALLRRVAAVALALELALAAWLGPAALLAWAAAAGFTLLMLAEFGGGRWLQRHLVLYAITHNPIVALLGVFAWATTGAAPHPAFAGYLAAASLGSLAFELGRKIRLPDEEIAGVASYSSALGRERAGWLLAGVSALALGCGAWTVWALAGPAPIPLALLAASAPLMLASALRARPAKSVESGATLLLLGTLMAIGVSAC